MMVSALELMPILCSALERGQRVRLTVTGGSMRPFMHTGGIVELEPLGSPLRVGDVVLVRCGPEHNRYVLHRLVRVKGDEVFVRGDAQRYCEGPFAHQNVLGRVVEYGWKGRVHRADRGLWRFLGRTWLACFPVGVWFLRVSVYLRGVGESM
jgi:signal peptidase I